MSTHKSIAKSAVVIGFATLCSRILGFARDIVIARIFGVYIYAQAFVIAFRIPNLFRDFCAEGATNAAFVPVFSEYATKHSKEEFWEVANVVLNLLLIAVSAITVLGIIFAPLIVRLIAPGFMADPLKLEATIQLTRIIFPYILLASLYAYAMGILNSLKHFSVPAFAPCLLNISIIICAMIFGEGITGLASGILIGGFLQLIVQIPVLYRKGFHLKLFKRFKHPAAKTIGKLMIPRVFSSCIYQLNNFVDSIFGSLAFIVGEGGVAVLYFAYRLIQFPVGIFSNSISQAILPSMSVKALEVDKIELKKTLSFGMRTSFFVMLPASFAFISLSLPIVRTIFEGGKFDAYSSLVTARVLLFYSIGLTFYSANKILQSCFFALKDTVTPTKISALNLGLNVLFNSILIFPLKIAGIALSSSLSGIISFVILFTLLKKRLSPLPIKDITSSFLKILLSSAFMALVCFFISSKLSAPHGLIQRAGYLAFLVVLGAISYVVFCFIFRVREMFELQKWVTKKDKLG